MNSVEPDNQFFRKGDKKIVRLFLKSADHDTQSGGFNNFQDVTYPLDALPNHVINDIVKSDEIEIKLGWYKIIGLDVIKPFIIALGNVNQNKIYSSTKKNSCQYLTYGENSYQLFDWEGIPGIFTSDYSFLRNRSINIKFLDVESETVLLNTAFSNNITYALTLLIVYK